MFDKLQYWNNRTAGKRGQGDEPTTVRPVLGDRPLKGTKVPTKKAVAKHTKRAQKVKEDNGRN